MGNAVEIGIFDFDAFHHGALPFHAEPCGNGFSEGKQRAVRFLRSQDIACKGNGISDALCLCRLGNDRGIIDSVCVLPQKPSVTFEMRFEDFGVCGG